MIITRDKIISIWFSILLFMQLFVYSFKVNSIIQLVSIILFIAYFKPSFSVNFTKKILLLILLLAIGIVGFLIHDFKMFNAIKDGMHFLKPILGLLIGYSFFKIWDDEKKFVRLIITLGIISALYHFILVFGFSDISSGTISSYRINVKDNFLELFSLFFLLYYNKYFHEKYTNSTLVFLALLGLFLSSILLYFSRSMIVLAGILWLTINGYTRLNSRNLQISGLIAGLIIALYISLFSFKLNPNAEGLEGFLYKIKLAPSEIFNTRINRQDHRELWDHWRGYEANRALYLMKENPTSYVFGMGHGSLVNLKFWAPLGDYKKGMRYISELHNGYVYVFYKTGIIGLLIYLYFLWMIYFYIHKKIVFSNLMISGIGVSFFITTLIITGIYNSRDIVIFLLGALLYFNEKPSNVLTKTTQIEQNG